MRLLWFAVSMSSILLSSQLLAWGLPSFPKARVETVPQIPSPYQLCIRPLRDQAQEDLFSCAEQEFWHGFSDGRLEVRKKTESVLGDIISLTKDYAVEAKRGRLLALRGYLRLAMALENAKSGYMLFGSMERDFQGAKKLDTENKNYDSFLDSVVMAKSAAFGNWKKATELALSAFEILKDQPANILALSGTTIGFPMNTGLPQKTIEFLENWVCPTDIATFCEENTLHAPFARPGLSFHYAEAFARMGNREKTVYYLNQAIQSPGYSDWQYQHLVEDAFADMDSYMTYWKSFAPDDSAFNKVYSNQNYGCVMCHGR